MKAFVNTHRQYQDQSLLGHDGSGVVCMPGRGAGEGCSRLGLQKPRPLTAGSSRGTCQVASEPPGVRSTVFSFLVTSEATQAPATVAGPVTVSTPRRTSEQKARPEESESDGTLSRDMGKTENWCHEHWCAHACMHTHAHACTHAANCTISGLTWGAALLRDGWFQVSTAALLCRYSWDICEAALNTTNCRSGQGCLGMPTKLCTEQAGSLQAWC